MAVDGGRRGRTISLLALAATALLLLAPDTPLVSAQGPSVGIGVVAVDGALTENFTLSSAGSYYLFVVPDAPSFLNATLTYSGGAMARANHTMPETTQVSLPQGNYTMSVTGRGRWALGWDLTNGTLQEFPDNQTTVGLLLPHAERLRITVALGDAQAVTLHVYDADLLPVGNATVTASGTTEFILPTATDGAAVITATPSGGNPNGLYGLSWTAGPLNPPIDVPTWPWFLLWILVPVAAAFLILVLLHRRGSRRGRP